jgi:peptidoglycan hydrolase-like protein with peptidoglycan-binding domain
MSRHVAAVSLVMLWVLVPADRALAQVKDLLRGALEGAVTSAIQNEVKKPQVTTSANTATSTREENRQIQMALNHFGYPAGTADGILGRRSSAAIAKFQASNGHSATGTLTNPQKSALLSSWRRSASGTPVNGVDLLGVIGAGQLILDDGSVSAGRRRQRTTTTTATAGAGDTVLQDSDQALERKRRRTVIDPIAGDQTGSTTIASPVVATEPSLRSATRGQQTGESTAVTTTRRTSTSSNTATTERRGSTTSNTTTTTVQPTETRIVPTGSSGGTSASSAARLRCQLRGSDPSACIAGN